MLSRHALPIIIFAKLELELYDYDGGTLFTCYDLQFEKSKYYSVVISGITEYAIKNKININGLRIHTSYANTDDAGSSPNSFKECAETIDEKLFLDN